MPAAGVLRLSFLNRTGQNSHCFLCLEFHSCAPYMYCFDLICKIAIVKFKNISACLFRSFLFLLKMHSAIDIGYMTFTYRMTDCYGKKVHV